MKDIEKALKVAADYETINLYVDHNSPPNDGEIEEMQRFLSVWQDYQGRWVTPADLRDGDEYSISGVGWEVQTKINVDLENGVYHPTCGDWISVDEAWKDDSPYVLKKKIYRIDPPNTDQHTYIRSLETGEDFVARGWNYESILRENYFWDPDGFSDSGWIELELTEKK